MWAVSYLDVLIILIAFYNWTQINVIFYISAYWLAFVFNLLHIATREDSTASNLPNLADDWSVTLMLS